MPFFSVPHRWFPRLDFFSAGAFSVETLLPRGRLALGLWNWGFVYPREFRVICAALNIADNACFDPPFFRFPLKYKSLKSNFDWVSHFSRKGKTISPPDPRQKS